MKKLPMFTYNLRMGNCLHPDTPCQLLCPVINIAMSNNFKHSHVLCTLHICFSNKARFSHISTVTYYILALGKKYDYASRASCLYIEINMFERF